jgi:hypothetical protein
LVNERALFEWIVSSGDRVNHDILMARLARRIRDPNTACQRRRRAKPDSERTCSISAAKSRPTPLRTMVSYELAPRACLECPSPHCHEPAVVSSIRSTKTSVVSRLLFMANLSFRTLQFRSCHI